MEIIEKFLESKYDDPALCEDGLFCNVSYIAVVDGVTSKGVTRWDGRSGGYHAKERILAGLSQLAGTEPATEVFRFLNSILHQEYGERTEYFLSNPKERLQATLVIYSVHHRQIWCFGDCQYMIDGAAFANDMKIDALVAEVRAVYLQLMLLEGRTVEELLARDPSWKIIYPLLEKQFLFSNCDLEYGYSVLDGFCGDFKSLVVHDVPKRSTVVLATDGYPVIKPTLQESEGELAAIKQNDPLCISLYKSTRGFTDGKTSLDDRAYIRFVT